MAASDVTIPQNGGHVKLHPYLITLVRWCVSCIWSTASVLLHRLVTTPLPPITASKPQIKAVPKSVPKRQAGTDHLHPEPKVECVILHTPEIPTLDVIFVHGLYGSLGNTWRQGDWRSKYKIDPTKVPLRHHKSNPCNCHTYKRYTHERDTNEKSFKQYENYDNILQNKNIYDSTYMNVNTYETQAEFVTDLFKSNMNCDINERFKCNCDTDEKCGCNADEKDLNECHCKINDNGCQVGCGCICDSCYSLCWPKDWIKEDFPGARVISINYTSDPYLWRPLWVKGNKRLRLHERAAQMMDQLLDLGVGQKPIIWVGHSKGGLFIKQIYCEAYESYIKLNKNNININSEDQSNIKIRQFNNFNENNVTIENINEIHPKHDNEQHNKLNSLAENGKAIRETIAHIKGKDQNFNFVTFTEDENTEICGCADNDDNLVDKQGINESKAVMDRGYNMEEMKSLEDDEKNGHLSLITEEDIQGLEVRSSLWEQSVGFMFYSVPHRGSPLADIKTPITARSIELLEISKNCDLVLELQDRWVVATSSSQPVVSSLVETCRTLMSVLWLRIVSVDSADAGVGSLYGVSVDHREICKPSSRTCLLYTELTGVIKNALSKCSCKK